MANIAIICNKYGLSGGMERYAYEISQQISASFPIVILAKKILANAEMNSNLIFKKLPVSGCPSKLKDNFFSFRVGRYLQKNPELVSIACNRCAHANIAICGGTHIGYLRAMGKPVSLWDRAAIALEKREYQQASFIVAHSQLMVDELQRYYDVNPEKIVLLYPPINTDKFKIIDANKRAALRAQLGFSAQKKYFLFPSGSHSRKGLDFLRSYLEQTKLPIELVVVGKERVTGKNIQSLPFTKAIEKLYQAADATIMASKYEPFGLVGIESVLCGSPVVFANNIGCTKVLDSRVNFSFQRDDKESLHSAVQKLDSFDRQTLTHPVNYIHYDISLSNHVKVLIQLADKVVK